MQQSRFLMCPPDYFEVAYEINPWMSVERLVDRKRAEAQWRAYYELLSGPLDAQVELLAPAPGLPDLVFTANAGLVRERIFVRSHFRFKERRGEEAHFEKWFKSRGYRVKTLDLPFCFEGEGDALSMGEELYTGYHFRSDLEAHEQAAGILRSAYFALELCDKRFYHLDTCFAPIDSQSALVFFPAFESCSQMILWETVPDPIRVSEEEALKFACNAVVAGQNVVLPSGCPNVSKELEKRGYAVYALDFSEFIKAGGAAKCLVLKL